MHVLQYIMHLLYYRDCAVPYVRHFHTGYGIFHCDSMKYYLMFHWIPMEYAVSRVKMSHVRDCANSVLCTGVLGNESKTKPCLIPYHQMMSTEYFIEVSIMSHKLWKKTFESNNICSKLSLHLYPKAMKQIADWGERMVTSNWHRHREKVNWGPRNAWRPLDWT